MRMERITALTDDLRLDIARPPAFPKCNNNSIGASGRVFTTSGRIVTSKRDDWGEFEESRTVAAKRQSGEPDRTAGRRV